MVHDLTGTKTVLEYLENARRGLVLAGSRRRWVGFCCPVVVVAVAVAVVTFRCVALCSVVLCCVVLSSLSVSRKPCGISQTGAWMYTIVTNAAAFDS